MDWFRVPRYAFAFLVVMAAAMPIAGRAQESISAAMPAPAPQPPTQPTTGPAEAEYAFAAVRVSSLGDEPSGRRIFEPMAEATGGTPIAVESLLLILLLDGCCFKVPRTTFTASGVDNGEGFRAWIDHLVRRGAILVYPIYRSSIEEAQMNIATTMHAALAELAADEQIRRTWRGRRSPTSRSRGRWPPTTPQPLLTRGCPSRAQWSSLDRSGASRPWTEQPRRLRPGPWSSSATTMWVPRRAPRTSGSG
jgi:hypothetical protein